MITLHFGTESLSWTFKFQDFGGKWRIWGGQEGGGVKSAILTQNQQLIHICTVYKCHFHKLHTRYKSF